MLKEPQTKARLLSESFFGLKEGLSESKRRRIANGVTDFLKLSGLTRLLEDEAFEEKFRQGMERWLESLLECEFIDEAYKADRVRIGRSYVKRGLGMGVILTSYAYTRKELMDSFSTYPVSSFSALNQRLDEDLSLVLKAYEKEQERLTEESFKRLETIKELSSPIIEVANKTLLIPLVGEMDESRMDSLEDRILKEVSTKKARNVLFEFSGLALADTHLTERLMKTCMAIKLLGAKVTFVGIRQALARTLVSIGADFEGFRVVGSLSEVRLG